MQYRFDLQPVFVSHMYPQISKELYADGLGQSVGIKFRIDKFRADLHQRAQKLVIHLEGDGGTKTRIHKAIYAGDLLLDNMKVMGMTASFAETALARESDAHQVLDGVPMPPMASDLPEDQRAWFDFYDFVDADRKPFDRNPRITMAEIGDCPRVNLCKRVRARPPQPEAKGLADERQDLEYSKFGHEPSHICFLGAAEDVGPTQIEITDKRIQELEARLASLPDGDDVGDAVQRQRTIAKTRLKALNRYVQDLSTRERRAIDNTTLEVANPDSDDEQEDGDGFHRKSSTAFENTIHIHNPRLLFNASSQHVSHWTYVGSSSRSCINTTIPVRIARRKSTPHLTRKSGQP